ncbi:MAG: sigma-70 family RNA polymerase sigma factor [Ruminococcus sp.]|nr:sigma-70 family RNA polymerase sigma factor [Ruminococcus sp.]
MDDASIIKLLFERNEQAVKEMKANYENLCYYIAGNILSQKEDQEECVNSAYMDVWSSIPPNKPDNLKTYLCKLVKNCALNRKKYNTAAKRNPDFSVSLDELAECIPDGKSVEERISDQQLGKAISAFLRTQPEKYRKVFVRRYWYSESVEDIAAFYDMNAKTVATYLFRVRKKLKAFLQKEGYVDE